MEQLIINYLNKYNISYIKIYNQLSLDIIYDLLIQNNETNITFFDPIIYYYYGIYYYINQKYEDMIHYLHIIIEKGNDNAMNILGVYYQYKTKQYDLMKKYYLMAIEKNNNKAMTNLGTYYQIEKNYDEMKKYYLMAIEKGNINAMCSLGYYYQFTEKNYYEMKKYYLMAIEKEHSDAMYYLGFYFEEIERNYDEMKKYYLMAIEKNHSSAMYNLGYYYEEIEKNKSESLKYYQMGANLYNKICINKINTIIETNFDISIAISIYNNLSKQNLKTLNDLLCKFHKCKDKLKENAFCKFMCINCSNENVKCVFLDCGHPLCTYCYGIDCPICKKN